MSCTLHAEEALTVSEPAPDAILESDHTCTSQLETGRICCMKNQCTALTFGMLHWLSLLWMLCSQSVVAETALVLWYASVSITLFNGKYYVRRVHSPDSCKQPGPGTGHDKGRNKMHHAVKHTESETTTPQT